MQFDLFSLGWDERRASGYPATGRPDRQPARVTRIYGGVCSVLTSDGLGRVSLGGCVLAAAASDPSRLPCPGDWVVVRTWPDGPTTVEAVLPRRTVLIDAGTGAVPVGQALAANVDTAAVAVEPGHLTRDLERIRWLLYFTHGTGMTPLVVLTENDHPAGADPGRFADRIARMDRRVGVRPVNTATGAGLAQLREYAAPGRTLALLGWPGGARSSLVDALAGAAVVGGRMRPGGQARPDVGARPSAGCRGLVPVPGGGAVIEAAGIPTTRLRGDGYAPTDNK